MRYEMGGHRKYTQTIAMFLYWKTIYDNKDIDRLPWNSIAHSNERHTLIQFSQKNFQPIRTNWQITNVYF